MLELGMKLFIPFPKPLQVSNGDNRGSDVVLTQTQSVINKKISPILHVFPSIQSFTKFESSIAMKLYFHILGTFVFLNKLKDGAY